MWEEGCGRGRPAAISRASSMSLRTDPSDADRQARPDNITSRSSGRALHLPDAGSLRSACAGCNGSSAMRSSPNARAARARRIVASGLPGHRAACNCWRGIDASATRSMRTGARARVRRLGYANSIAFERIEGVIRAARGLGLRGCSANSPDFSAVKRSRRDRIARSPRMPLPSRQQGENAALQTCDAVFCTQDGRLDVHRAHRSVGDCAPRKARRRRTLTIAVGSLPFADVAGRSIRPQRRC